MRYFALTAIGSFAIMSATALCAAQVAVSIGAAGFSGTRIELVGGAQHRNDGNTGAAASSEHLLACGNEEDHAKHSGKQAVGSRQTAA
ncbi:MAG TPA: hypothetical protein VN649_05635 [Ramlibacter sp.]|nr:hypothetical protein [Ramlibacter sp.]